MVRLQVEEDITVAVTVAGTATKPALLPENCVIEPVVFTGGTGRRGGLCGGCEVVMLWENRSEDGIVVGVGEMLL